MLGYTADRWSTAQDRQHHKRRTVQFMKRPEWGEQFLRLFRDGNAGNIIAGVGRYIVCRKIEMPAGSEAIAVLHPGGYER